MVFRSLFGSDPSDLKRLAALGMEEADAGAGREDVPAASIDLFEEKPGDWIGPYRLLTVLGEGGMGIVFQAEQRRPIQRQVALKLIKPGMDSKRILARFEVEQQALARMDHPHIARVYDAGLTAGGRPFFVMEYVQGVPLTEYCDTERLSVADRLTLFADVCDAIQHAHQRGIIHRDLKPSNVLVQQDNAQAVVKVIDFGVARAMHQPLTDRTVSSAGGHLVGTLPYMSPEQANPDNPDIDTRTDVYSLGVVLYELLTGVLPFEWHAAHEGGMAPAPLHEELPQTPSTRLSTIDRDTVERLARLRQVTREGLDRQLRGDLDWITLKALETDRTRRYDTARALGADIDRHLHHEPVSAVPPSVTYRIGRFLRRHRAQAVSVVLAGVLLVLGVTGLMVRRRYQRDLAAVASVLHPEQLEKARDYFIRHQFTEALERVRPLLDSPHVGPEARLLYASLLVEGKHDDQALDLLARLASEEPSLAGVAHALMARLYWESDLPDREKLDRVTTQRGLAQERLPETADAYFLRALTCAATRDMRHHASAALDLDPSHYESRKLLALLDLASAQHASLREHADILIALRPAPPLGYQLKAMACVRLGQYERAINAYQRAIARLAPDDAGRHDLTYGRDYAHLLNHRYGEVLSQTGMPSKGADDLRTALLRFWAHIGLGELEKAREVSRTLRTAADTETWRQLQGLSRRYVFDVLSLGQSWYPANSRPEGGGFRVLLDAEVDYHRYAATSRRILANAFTPAWSPDGRQLALSLGTPGRSGLAVLTVDSGDIDLLMTPGKDPAWSPDGKRLAFVRDRQILPLVDFMKTETPSAPRSVTEEEVWIIQADGAEPRRIARGSRPSWSKDGTALYYYSRTRLKHFKIDLATPDAMPTPVLDYYGCTNCYPSVSPDERYVTYVQDDTVKVMDLASGQRVTQWQGPPGIWVSSWDPDRKHIWLGGGDSPGIRTGLWCYDLETDAGKRVLAGPIIGGQTSATGQLVFCSGGPPYDIWVGTVDYPHVSEAFRTFESGGPQEGGSLPMPIPFQFGRVENLGPVINGAYNDGTPFITRDGRYLYFASDRPGSVGGADLWMCARDVLTGDWGRPVHLGGEVNGPGQDFFPCVSQDGLQLYFFSEREGGQGRGDIWLSARSSPDDQWPNPVNLGPPVNGPHMDASPHLSADGLELYFTSNRSGGSLDLWVSTRAQVTDPWADPENLGPAINSPNIDSCPFLSADGLHLFFNSTRSGQQDLFWTSRSAPGAPWHPAVPLGAEVNSDCGETCACLSPGMAYLYFCECMNTTPRPGGHGGTDLWRIPLSVP